MSLTQDEVRLLGLAAPQILKLMQEREKRVLARMYGEFKNSKQDQFMNVAEFACIRDIINDINSALRQHTAQEEKRHANADPDGFGPSSR